MLRVKMASRNEVYIIDGDNIVKFDSFGECIGENIMRTPDVTNNMQNLPVMSVLSSNGKVEVALFKDDIMTRYDCKLKATDIMAKMMSIRGYARMLKRNGTQETIKFNQLIYIFPAGYNFNTLMSSLNLEGITNA